jgi:hypothetical protein
MMKIQSQGRFPKAHEKHGIDFGDTLPLVTRMFGESL